jgi:PKD repeat protein
VAGKPNEAGNSTAVLVDDTGYDTYRLRTASYCAPETPPVAALSASVLKGLAPLTVAFDGSGSSDPDPSDTVAVYHFNFGDGSDEVAQSSPQISHVFNQPGTYAVKLAVDDSRARHSSNTAQVLIQAVDQLPAAINFKNVTGVATGTVITSNPVTLSGFSGAQAIGVSNGQYNIDGGKFTSATGTAMNGQKVRVRQRSASAAASAVTTTLAVGNATGSFTSTTGNQDSTPNAFSFGRRNGVAAGSVVVSRAVTPAGYDTPAPIVPVNGLEYSINGGAFTSARGLLQPGQSLQVRHTAAAAGKIRHSALRVGGTLAQFTTQSAN